MKIIVNNNNQSVSSDKVMRQLLRGIFDTTKTLVLLFFLSFQRWVLYMAPGNVARNCCKTYLSAAVYSKQLFSF